MLVTGSRDYTARLWDIRNSAEIEPPLRHESWVFHAEFSPDGARILTASHDRSARVWAVGTHLPVARPMDHRDGVRRASFSPDGTMIVSGANDETVVLWDAASGRPLQAKFNHDKQVMDVAFDSSGRRLATADYGGTVKIWDIEPVSGVELGNTWFSADGARYVTMGKGEFSVFDSLSRAALAERVPVTETNVSVRFTTDGQRLVFVSHGSNGLSVCVADSRSAFRPGEWRRLGNVKNFEPSPDGQIAYGVAGTNFVFWNLNTGAMVAGPEPVPFKQPLPRAVFSKNGRSVALLGKARVHATAPRRPNHSGLNSERTAVKCSTEYSRAMESNC